MSAADLYDWEVLVPAPCATILRDNGLSVWTISDDATFQKARPRVEIVYRHIGEETPRRWSPALPNGSKRGCAFQGELKLHAITAADPPGKADHSRYRATVRAVVIGLPDVLNNSSTAFPFHLITWMQPGNEETGIRTQDGLQQTTFPFQVKIMIKPDAWSQLTT